MQVKKNLLFVLSLWKSISLGRFCFISLFSACIWLFLYSPYADLGVEDLRSFHRQWVGEPEYYAHCRSFLHGSCVLDAAVSRFVTEEIRDARDVLSMWAECGVPSRLSVRESTDIWELGSTIQKRSKSRPGRSAVLVLSSKINEIVDNLHIMGRGLRVSYQRDRSLFTEEIKQLYRVTDMQRQLADPAMPAVVRDEISLRIKEPLLELPRALVKQILAVHDDIRNSGLLELISATKDIPHLIQEALKFLDEETQRVRAMIDVEPSYKGLFSGVFKAGSVSPQAKEFEDLERAGQLIRRVEPVLHAIRLNVLDIEYHINWYRDNIPNLMAMYRPASLSSFEDEIAAAASELERLWTEVENIQQLEDRWSTLARPVRHKVRNLEATHVQSRRR